MKTKIFLVFSLLIVFTDLIQAQQKTIQEELQELRDQTRKQNDMLSMPNKTDSTSIFRQNKKWSLEECIQYAIENNISIKQLRLNQENAEIQKSTAVNSRLPNLNANLGQQWNYGRTQDIFGEYYTSRDSLGEYYDLNQSTIGANIQSTLPLFTGFRIPNQIARAKLDLQAAIQDLEKAKDDLSLAITSLFLQALFYKELCIINDKQLEISKTQVERTKILVQGGNVPKSQLYDIEAQEAKDEVNVVNARNNLELALLDLSQSLELERNTEFDIYAPDFNNDIITAYLSSLQPPEIIYENAVNFKPIIKGQEYRVESSKKSLKIAESGYYPQLDFTLGIGTNYNHISKPSRLINPMTHEDMILNLPFSEQLRNYGTKLIAFNLNIPIFNRFQVRNQVRSARIDILNQQLILENNKKKLYKEIQTAFKNATAAQAKYRASERAVKSANESFDYTRKRYEIGNATVFEFNDAQNRLIQSQSELAQAKYEYILRTKILDFYNGVPIQL